jgi:hypothetical protein
LSNQERVFSDPNKLFSKETILYLMTLKRLIIDLHEKLHLTEDVLLKITEPPLLNADIEIQASKFEARMNELNTLLANDNVSTKPSLVKDVVDKVDGIIRNAMKKTQKELGVMSDRILWMATQIGVMADRIGEMANRIVHTEHLIVNSAVLLVDLGIIIDGLIKHLANSFLYAISMTSRRDFTPLSPHSKHLDVISDNIKQILRQQHEISIKMLEAQTGLREKTLDGNRQTIRYTE